jgi:hypothetical protein
MGWSAAFTAWFFGLAQVAAKRFAYRLTRTAASNAWLAGTTFG